MSSYIDSLSDCIQECFLLLNSSTALQPLLNLNLSELEQQSMKQLELLQPKVTILGSYNAGKSTLINVLVGQERAKTSAIPQTQAITPYWWDNVQLIDTPGLNTTAEHKDIVQQCIAQSEKIIFVLRDYEVESRSLYRQLIKILAQNKRLAIVLNHQLPQPQVEDYQKRLRYHLQQYAADALISHQTLLEVPILSLNLLTARRAQVQKKPSLLQHSGYPALHQGLTRWLEKRVSQQQEILNFQRYMEQQLFLPVDRLLKTIQVNPEQIRALYSSKLQFEKERLETRRVLRAFIQQQIKAAQPRIMTILANTESSLMDVQLQQLHEKLQKDLFVEMNTRLQITNQTVLKPFKAELEKMKQDQPASKQAWYASFLQQGRQLAQNYSAKPTPKLSGALTSESLPALGKLMRQNMGGIAVNVFMTAYDAYQAHQQEQQDNQRTRAMSAAKHQAAQSIQQDLYHLLLDYLEQAIANSYDPKLLQMQTTFDQLLDAEQKYQEIADQFADLYDEFKQFDAAYV